LREGGALLACVRPVHRLARKQIDKIFTIDPEPRRF